MRSLRLEPLTAEAFAPFGDVVDAPPAPEQRVALSDTLASSPVASQPRLGFACATPWSLPLEAREMERHMHSCQCFVPMDVGRWVILVAPDAGGAPDAENIHGFLARGDQAVNYHRGTWHHPLRVLDRPGRFAVLMWSTGHKPDDEEWATLPEPLSLTER